MVRHLGVWCLEDNRNGLLLLTRQSVVGACKQPTGSQLLTMRQLRWVVLDAPGATLAESQAVAGFCGGADAPGATLAESQAVAGE